MGFGGATTAIFEMDADFSRSQTICHASMPPAMTGATTSSVGSRYVSGVNVVNWPMGRVLMSWLRLMLRPSGDGCQHPRHHGGFVCCTRRVLWGHSLDE